jgi:hypothetical protein
MAISDVLSAAEKRIEKYLQSDMYSELEPEIRAKVLAVLRAMRALREELDAPPDALISGRSRRSASSPSCG